LLVHRTIKCYKTAEPIVVPFGVQIPESKESWGAHRCQPTNTIWSNLCGSDDVAHTTLTERLVSYCYE